MWVHAPLTHEHLDGVLSGEKTHRCQLVFLERCLTISAKAHQVKSGVIGIDKCSLKLRGTDATRPVVVHSNELRRSKGSSRAVSRLECRFDQDFVHSPSSLRDRTGGNCASGSVYSLASRKVQRSLTELRVGTRRRTGRLIVCLGTLRVRRSAAVATLRRSISALLLLLRRWCAVASVLWWRWRRSVSTLLLIALLCTRRWCSITACLAVAASLLWCYGRSVSVKTVERRHSESLTSVRVLLRHCADMQDRRWMCSMRRTINRVLFQFNGSITSGGIGSAWSARVNELI